MPRRAVAAGHGSQLHDRQELQSLLRCLNLTGAPWRTCPAPPGDAGSAAPSAFGQPGQGDEYRRRQSQQQGRAGDLALEETGPD
jgi:hypothetical protein